jgi:hypothetical protein
LEHSSNFSRDSTWMAEDGQSGRMSFHVTWEAVRLEQGFSVYFFKIIFDVHIHSHNNNENWVTHKILRCNVRSPDTWHHGGIRTHDLLLRWRRRWPIHHAVMAMIVLKTKHKTDFVFFRRLESSTGHLQTQVSRNTYQAHIRP